MFYIFYKIVFYVFSTDIRLLSVVVQAQMSGQILRWWNHSPCKVKPSLHGLHPETETHNVLTQCRKSYLNTKFELKSIKMLSTGIVRNVSAPSWFLSFWVQASLSSTPASPVPSYPCGPMSSEASAADPALDSHREGNS